MKVIAYPAFKNKKYNPYNYLLYTEIVKQGNVVEEFTLTNVFLKKYDIVHVHWPPEPTSKNVFTRVAFFLSVHAMFLVAKIKGAKVVWTIHNVTPHDKKVGLIDTIRMNYFIRLLSGYILLNNVSHAKVLSFYPKLRKKPFKIIPHGSYRGYYENTVSKEGARAKLGIPPSTESVALFFGLIKRYKGLDELINVFEELHGPVVLIVAGDLLETEAKHFQWLFSKLSDSIKLFIRRISDDDVQTYFNASDILVLPYRNILNSGAMLLSLSFNLPVLTTSNETTVELANEFGENVIQTYSGPLTASILQQALTSVDTNLEVNMNSRSWSLIASSTLEFYSTLCLRTNT